MKRKKNDRPHKSEYYVLCVSLKKKFLGFGKFFRVPFFRLVSGGEFFWGLWGVELGLLFDKKLCPDFLGWILVGFF